MAAKKGKKWYALSLSCVLSLTSVGCSDGESSPGQQNSEPGSLADLGIDDGASEGAATQKLAAPDEETILVLKTGAQVTIPAGALDEPIELGLTRPPDKQALDLVKNVGEKRKVASAPYIVTPHGTTFKKEVEVTLPVSKERNPEAFSVLWLKDEADPQWKALGKPEKTREGKATIKVSHFSVLVVVEEPEEGGLPPDAGLPSDEDAGGTEADAGSPDPNTGDAGAEPSELYFVGGSIYGVCESVTLKNASTGEELVLTENGAFVFEKRQAHATPYDVTVATTASGQTCTVFAGSGTVHARDVTNLRVTCQGPEVTVGGTVSGLDGDALVLRLNADPDVSSNLVLSANASFEFSAKPSCGSQYWTEIVTLPATQRCVIKNGLGTAQRTQPPMQVECYAPPPAVGAPRRLFLTEGGGIHFATYSDSQGYHYERRTASLEPDTTLSSEGYVQFPLGGFIETGARDFAVLSDGAILAAGNGDGIDHCPGNSQHDATVVKWLANGAPDPEFGGGDGYVQDNFYGVCNDWYNEHAEALVVQSTGRIVVGGLANNGTDDRGVLRAFTAEGTLDTTFANSGRLELELPSPAPGPITNVRRIVRNGDDSMWVLACQNQCAIVARYTADGVLDGAVKPTYFVEQLPNRAHDLLDFHAMEVDSQGRLWLGGRSHLSNVPTLDGDTVLDRAVIARMTPQGAIDSTFGEGGFLYLNHLPLQNTDLATGISSVHFTNEGDVVVGGAYRARRATGLGVAFIAKLDAQGQVDTSFGRDGVITLHPNGNSPFESTNAGVTAMVSTPSGQLFSVRSYYEDGRMRFVLELN